MKFAIVCPRSLRILQMCSGTPESVEAVAKLLGGVSVEAPEDVDDATHYYDGVSGIFVRRPPRPTPHHEWSGSAWVDPRSIEQRRADAWSAIKAARNAAMEPALMEAPFGLVQIDAASRAAMREELDAGPGVPLLWKLADNTLAPVTTDDLAEVLRLARERRQRAFMRGEELRARINQAETAEELEEISWTD